MYICIYVYMYILYYIILHYIILYYIIFSILQYSIWPLSGILPVIFWRTVFPEVLCDWHYILMYYLTFYLTSYLTCYLIHILAFYLSFYLAFYYMTLYMTSNMTFYLTFYLTSLWYIFWPLTWCSQQLNWYSASTERARAAKILWLKTSCSPQMKKLPSPKWGVSTGFLGDSQLIEKTIFYSTRYIA